MPVYAQNLVLPVPGVIVQLSPKFNPPVLKGIKVHPDNPFRFDFILDIGDSFSKSKSSPNALIGDPQQEQLKTEATKLIKFRTMKKIVLSPIVLDRQKWAATCWPKTTCSNR